MAAFSWVPKLPSESWQVFNKGFLQYLGKSLLSVKDALPVGRIKVYIHEFLIQSVSQEHFFKICACCPLAVS